MSILKNIVILLLLVFGIKAVAQQERPNVVFILTDDENLNSLGCYGYKVQTPNIDKIAENGIRFTNANVVHSVCSPSRYAILTGRYYFNNYHPEYLKAFPANQPDCVGNSISLEDDGMNVANVLKSSGYNTGFVGKFHVGHHEMLGSNRNWEKGGLKTYSKTKDPRVDKSISEKIKHNHEWWCKAIKAYGFDYVNGVYSANLREFFNEYMNVHNVEWTADAATQFIDEQKDEKNPFFLYVSTTYPHGPAPERKVKGDYIVSLDADPALTGEGVVEEGAEEKRQRRQQIKSEIKKGELATSPTARWWDDSVGRIINKLKETGHYENTIIIYTSDHGKKNHGKTTLYESGVHVPLLVQWPAKIKKARDYDHIIGSVDFTPTILDACKAKVPARMKTDGVSFYNVLKGSDVATREALLLKMGYACGVKTDMYKYITVRYPKKVEAQIERGQDFTGHKKERIKQPYYMLHKQLSQKSEHAFENYWVRDQIYAYPTDKEEQENIYNVNEELTNQMKELMMRELNKANSTRPYGEFVK